MTPERNGHTLDVVARITYFIRAIDPVDPVVSPDLRTRLYDGLSKRFDPEYFHWEGITITSIPFERRSAAVHEAMHARLVRLLDDIDPTWTEQLLIEPYREVLGGRDRGAQAVAWASVQQ